MSNETTLKPQTLSLKWGTVKGWSNLQPATVDVLQKWADLGTSFSAMRQRDTPEQKALICEVIDMVDEVWNDWNGEIMTAEEAKTYVMEYKG